MRFLPELRRIPSRLHPTSALGIIRSYNGSSRDSKSTAVLSFGDNSHGALGLPLPPFDTYEPTKVPSLPSSICSVSAGHYHSLAVTASGEVWAWGRNDEGQLGRGLSTPRDTWNKPRKVECLDDLRVRAAFASGVVSAAIGVDGSLWVWGKSKRGQLGLGKGVTETIKPSKVEALAGKEIAKVSFGWGHALAQTSEGELLGWGYSADGRLGQMGEEFKTQSLLHPSSGVSTTEGKFNDVLAAIEKLVLDEMEKEKDMPIIWEPRPFQELLNHVAVLDVACGLDHSLILCNNGELLTCGNNIYGQLGRATEGSKLLPVNMSFQPLSVSAGLGHSLAICRLPSQEDPESAAIFSWGWNRSSQLGRLGQEDIPGIVEGLGGERPSSVSGGRAHSIALTSKGDLWTWGSGRNGRLGLGSSADEALPALVECLDGVEVLQAASGFDHNLLLVAE